LPPLLKKINCAGALSADNWITLDPKKEKEVELSFIPDKYSIHCTSVGENCIGYWNYGEVAVYAVL